MRTRRMVLIVKLPELTNADVMRVAAAATVDPRTVRKYLAGGTVRGWPGQRVLEALVALKFVTGGSNGRPAPAEKGEGPGAGRAGGRRAARRAP